MSDRWKMNRIGFVNFWLYDEEDFEFVDGKLLLRGQNGSGKSITTQSFIPFVLDGDRTPSRLDPFGSSDRRMEYYFLGMRKRLYSAMPCGGWRAGKRLITHWDNTSNTRCRSGILRSERKRITFQLTCPAPCGPSCGRRMWTRACCVLPAMWRSAIQCMEPATTLSLPSTLPPWFPSPPRIW